MKAKSTKTALVVAALTVGILSGCTSSNRTAESVPAEPVATDYQPSGAVAMTLPQISEALADGTVTSRELVAQYLARIDAVDKSGPGLNSVLTLNPDALDIARELDAQREAGQILGSLHGVPVLLKDNIESKDAMPTTAGALALQNNVTGRDSPLVAGLRAQGAIILGKTNLSQWANFRSEHSMSGWSALGGQVRNPHMLDRNPCGSSSGSGAALAASLAAATVGTETNGSITCPSTVNGIVGFKPSVGIVPQDFIVPISHSQDTAGPMTKTVTGAAMMMNAMATETPQTDYTSRLNDDALEGVSVGVLRFATGSDARIQALFDRALKDLEAAGAVLVDINEEPQTPDNFGKMAYDLLKYEFKSGINDYLASTASEQVEPRSLEALIAYNEAHASDELALFDQSIFVASQEMDSLDSDGYRESVRQVQQISRKNIDALLANEDVDVLVAPTGVIAPRVDPINGDVWPGGWPGYGSAAARAGYPHATVPMGGVHALPVGLSFIGSNLQDANVLSYAYAYEQVSQRRLTPQYYENAEALVDINRAMNPSR